jgi:hypothetical protein
MNFFDQFQGSTDKFDSRMLLDQYSSSSSSSTTICSARCHQERALMILPIISGSLSIIGSLLILYCIATHPSSAHTQRRQGRMQRGGASKITYERIMIGLTCADFINSLQSIAGNFPAPVDTPGFWYASGTQGTCTAQGFFTILAHSTGFYSTSLSIYFVLCMLPKVSDNTIKHRVEPLFHAISITIPLVFAVLGLVLNLYNPTACSDSCSFAVYPMGCDQLGDYSSCTRGQYVGIVTSVLMAIGLILFCTILVCMITIYMLTWLQYRKMKSLYSITRTSTVHEHDVSSRTSSTTGLKSLRSTFLSRPSVINNTEHNHNQSSILQRKLYTEQLERQNGNTRKLRRIATQGLLYISTFIFTWIWTITLILLHRQNKQVWYDVLTSKNRIPALLFTLRVFQRIFYPLQGLMNFFIYIRPTYIDLRTNSTATLSRCEAIKSIIFNSQATTQTNNTANNLKQQHHCLFSKCIRGVKSTQSCPVSETTIGVDHLNNEADKSDCSDESKAANDREESTMSQMNQSNLVSTIDDIAAVVVPVHQGQDDTVFDSESCDEIVFGYQL